GTGASCIFPLLGHKKFGWKFIATEIDSNSIKWANKNIMTNKLDKWIKVIKIEKSRKIFNFLKTCSKKFDFSMCNPPFFEDMKQVGNNKKRVFKFYKKITKATQKELVCSGGELAFITKMIKQSLKIQNKIRWFTTMVGRLKTFKQILEKLKLVKKESNLIIKTAVLRKGRQSRWFVAWSFEQNK
ncbi:hypothetical protein MHBO_002000, partial [Bonamia ostreae]